MGMRWAEFIEDMDMKLFDFLISYGVLRNRPSKCGYGKNGCTKGTFRRVCGCVGDFFSSLVCELDLIFNFHKKLRNVMALWQAYYILDEILIAGELQESSKKTVARLIAAQDSLVEAAKEQENSISNIIAQATK
ncbi:AP-1 complex subunit sigma-2 [Striga asiatica]|uniref:AP-1 complex subunit sigma-2 n=1 Tax=Striga asiatica TaxID=4170 RepID=A0A5A7RE49_STRAF|nr:AP-1 complex subunit sigma-2 [Striga asiatica]